MRLCRAGSTSSARPLASTRSRLSRRRRSTRKLDLSASPRSSPTPRASGSRRTGRCVRSARRLHRLENALMLPSGDPSFLAGGAALLDGAALAAVGPLAAQEQSIFLVGVVVTEPFTGRTNVNVLLGHVAEVLLAEAPFRL